MNKRSKRLIALIICLSTILLMPFSLYGLIEPSDYQKPDIIPLDFEFIHSSLDPNQPVVYFSSPANKKVYALNYETKALKTLSFELAPSNMKYYQGELYIVLSPGVHRQENGALAIIDTDSFTLKDTISLDINPYEVVIDHDGYIYVIPGSEPYHLVSYNRSTKQKISEFTQYSSPQEKAEIHPTKNRLISGGHNPYYLDLSKGKFLNYYRSPDLSNSPFDSQFTISPDGKYIFYSSGLITNDRFEPVTKIEGETLSISSVFDLKNDRFISKHGNIVTAYDYNQGMVDQKNGFPITDTFHTYGAIIKLYYQNEKMISISYLNNHYSTGEKKFLEIYTVPKHGLPTIDPLYFPGSEVSLPALLPDSPKVKSLPFGFEPLDSLLDPNRPILYLTNHETNSVYALNYETNTWAEIPFEMKPERFAFYQDKLYLTLTHGHERYSTQLNGEIAVIDAKTFSYVDKIDVDTDPFDLVVNQDGYLYVSPGSNDRQSIQSYSTVTKEKIDQSSRVHAQSTVVLAPATNTLYVNYTNYSSLDRVYSIESFQINQGRFSGATQPWSFSYDQMINSNSLISPDSKFFFNGHGMVLSLNQSATTKINGFQDIAFDLENNRFFAGRKDGAITIYDYRNQNLGNIFPILGTFHNQGNISALQYQDYQLFVIGNNAIKIFTIDPGTIPSTEKAIPDEASYDIDDQGSPFGLLGVYPVSDSEEMPVNTPIVLQMNQLISPGVNFDKITLQDSYGNTYPITKYINGHTLQIVLENDLLYSNIYTLQIPSNALASTDQESYGYPISIRFETGSEYSRYGGDDRIETSIQISRAGWDTAQMVFLATSEDYPDALTAAPLAKKYHAPILLTPSNTLPDSIKEELNRLKPMKIVIIGGEGAISKGVEQNLPTFNSNGRVDRVRISGIDRYQTSYNIAQTFAETDTVIVATGTNFPDALSVASYAAANEIPILLSRPDGLDQQAAAYVEKSGAEKAYVIGGTGVLSSKIEHHLPHPERIAGSDRYDTNQKVLSNLYTDYSYTFFATGENFPDALAGSPLAGQTEAPIVLLSGDETKNNQVLRSIRDQIKMKHILGAEGVIPSAKIQGLFAP